VTDEIYQALFARHDSAAHDSAAHDSAAHDSAAHDSAAHDSAARDGGASIHLSRWPTPDARLDNQAAETLGETLIEIATAVRRYKSEHNLPLGTQIERLQLATGDAGLSRQLRAAAPDISSITRAERVELALALDASLQAIQSTGDLLIALGVT
jgi:valyl-tRNA synthetase